jgi:Cytochrome c554 and c-prime
LVFVVVFACALIWAFSGANRETSQRAVKALPGDPKTAAMYIGAKACAECHAGEYAHFTRSGHARTLRMAAATQLTDKMNGLSVPDPEHDDVAWSYSHQDGTLTAERRVSGRADVERQMLEYAFGSGAHGVTFLTIRDRDPGRVSSIEHRMTFYPVPGVMDLTPGHRVSNGDRNVRPTGRLLGAALTLQCFGCHTTLTSSRGNKVLDLETLIPNISCERCHGPGRAHVEAARRGESELKMPFGPASGWTAEAQIRACGECHRLPETVDSGVITPENFSLARFPPVGILQSRCYQESKGALSCVTCHDPHAKSSNDHRVYEAVCLNCHQDSKSQTLCSVSPNENCLACHMPKRRLVADGVFFTDHWIVRKPK